MQAVQGNLKRQGAADWGFSGLCRGKQQPRLVAVGAIRPVTDGGRDVIAQTFSATSCTEPGTEAMGNLPTPCLAWLYVNM